ncbi:MAG: beta-L-arabinofuranosidase domain-containing protein [Planctomycetota bacterium]
MNKYVLTLALCVLMFCSQTFAAAKMRDKYVGARPLDLSKVRLLGGPLKHAQDLDAKYLLELEPDRMLAFYRQRAGLEPKAKPYTGWDGGGRNLTGHIAGHYLSAVSLMWAATGDARFKERAYYLVEELKEVQDKHGDGFLNAQEGARECFEAVSRGDIGSGGFDLNGLWVPWYVLHKTLAGLRDAYRYTGNQTALEIEINSAEWAEGILSGLTEAQNQRMLNAEFGGMNEVLVDLYADTGDKRWLELSYRFEHRSFVEPLKRHQDILEGKHGNTQVPKLVGSADRFACAGEPGDVLAAGFFWDRVAGHHSFATGGHGKDEYFGKPDVLSDRIDGRTAETCNVYNMLKLTRTLFSVRPDAHYADFHERALFNHILASIDPEDGRTCYMVPVGRRVQHEYADMFRSFTCCVGTGMESHALHGDGIYYESGDRLWVNIYAPSTAEWTAAGAKLRMDTDFPEGESAKLTFTLDAPREFVLALRRPAWAGDGFTVKVNGEIVSEDVIDPLREVPESGRRVEDRRLPESGSYVELKRTWKTGDAVELTLRKTLRLEPLPDNPRRTAIMWGPLVLAGDLGPEQRRRGGSEGRGVQKRPPVFVAAESPVDEWLKPVPDKPGHFRTDGVGRAGDVEFVPFYRLHRRAYAVYCDLLTEPEWQRQAAERAAERERLAALQSAVNLAAVAEPSCSYVSGDTSLAVLSDENEPRSSRDRPSRAYGNWPRRGTQWVQYEWSRPISTNMIGVYWWDDNRGVRLPKACRLLYWDGERFIQASNPSGLGVEGNKFNTTTFDEVRTTKLRLEIDASGTYSTGILEWKVCDSGKSPDFPPRVEAGVDRIVMIGGRTHLEGRIKTLKNVKPKVTWSKVSGPGRVEFADAGAPVTTAAFSQAGDYVLKLNAGQGQLRASAELAVKVEAPPPAEHLDLIDTKHYTIDSPLWNGRTKALIVNWIPHCIEKISDPDLKEGGINNFIDAANKLAGKPHERHRGYVFSNAWVYNTIEAMCVALMFDPKGDSDIIEAHELMRATLADWVPKILAAQEPDGYIQTAYTLSDRQRWSPRYRSDHEGYVAGYFLDAAIAHHLLTDGKDLRLYNAAKRLADCWDENLGPPPKKEWYDGHQAMEIGLVRFGRFVNKVEGPGKGDKYIKLAKFLLDCRRDGSEYDQSHVPVVQQYEAVGHAVRAVYSYAGMADVAMETGDTDYRSAVISLWDNIVNRKYYVTGGVGSGETSEGFGPDYSLRHNAYCESCSSCGEIFFQHKLNLTYRDAKFADLFEETLYNALLGSIDLEGRNFYYQNPLDSRRRRYEWHGCPCCVGNISRTLLMLPTWTYAKSDDSIYVNLFIGSTMTIEDVAGTDVEMVQKTDYPWSGNVSVTVNPKQTRSFSIRIRTPDRDVSELYTAAPDSDGIASISVNGSPIRPAVEKGYATITRQWKAGDKIDLKLPMKVQRVKGSDKIATTAGRVALRYGPLIYNCERVDQDIDNILSPDAALDSEFEKDLLGGVMVIKGTWADGSRLTAIPNYVRNNRDPETSGDRERGAVTASVWLKDQ